MFNKKKWLLLLLTATLVCVSAGCGNETATSSSPSSAPGASSSNQGESTTIPTQPETTAAVESTPSSSAAETTAPPAPTTTEAPPPPTTTAPTVSGMAAGEKATSQTVEFTMLSARKDPNNSRYLVTFTLKNLDALEHPYTYAQRLHLLAADKTRIPASSLSADGVDLNGKSLASGDSITAEAVFTLPEGFQPVNFTYTYDIMGFGIFTYRLDG